MVKKLKKKAWLIAGPTGEDSMLQSLSQLEFPAYGFEVIIFSSQYSYCRNSNFAICMVLGRQILAQQWC